jgi:hypothetical protein
VEKAMSKADYIEKLKRFHAQHGRAPTAGECGAGIASHKRIKSLPAYTSLQAHFGTFRKALAAAGLTPRPHGLRMGRKPGRSLMSGEKQKRYAPAPKRKRPIMEPHWPVILKEAKEALDRRCA